MKIIHPFLLLLLALPLESIAQKSKDEDHHHRNYVRGGYHMSDLVGDQNFDPRSGYYVGYHHAMLKLPIVGLSLGVEFNSAGASRDGYEYRTSYLGLPINARLKVGPMFIDGGLTTAYKLADKVVFEDNEVNGFDTAEDWDILLHAGAGIKLGFLGVEARYRYGMLEPFEGYNNTGIQVGLSVYL